VIEGNTFIHPDLRLTFTVPNGYYMVNGTDAVSINGQGGQAQMTSAAYNGDLELVRAAGVPEDRRRAAAGAASTERTTINGLPVVYGACAGQHRPEHGRRAWSSLRIRARPGLPLRDDHPCRAFSVFEPMFDSMRRITRTRRRRWFRGGCRW
jgi:hypothetical protein